MSSVVEPRVLLKQGLSELGYPENVVEPLLSFAALVERENTSTNLLAAHSDLREIIAAHVLDSLAVVAGKELKSPVVDVGSGAGFPAVPIAIAYPTAVVAAFEPRAKREIFLRYATTELGLSNLRTYKLTAETAGRASWRERAGTVTIRALSTPATNLEYGLPLLKLGGRLALYLGRQAEPSAHEREVADLLGGSLVEASTVRVPYLDRVRHAWWFEKTKATPATYPRRSKIPSKQPL